MGETYNSIDIEDLDEETRQKLGLDMVLPPELGDMGRGLVILGKLLNVLKDLSDKEASEALRNAQLYVLSRKHAPEIRELQIMQQRPAQVYTPSMDHILSVVAQVMECTVTELKNRDRSEPLVSTRQVAMYILWMTNTFTLAAIGRALGNRSPATVSHAYGRIGAQLTSDPKLKSKVVQIQGAINSGDPE